MKPKFEGIPQIYSYLHASTPRKVLLPSNVTEGPGLQSFIEAISLIFSHIRNIAETPNFEEK
jgi:hypothetical protein